MRKSERGSLSQLDSHPSSILWPVCDVYAPKNRSTNHLIFHKNRVIRGSSFVVEICDSWMHNNHFRVIRADPKITIRAPKLKGTTVHEEEGKGAMGIKNMVIKQYKADKNW